MAAARALERERERERERWEFGSCREFCERVLRQRGETRFCRGDFRVANIAVVLEFG